MAITLADITLGGAGENCYNDGAASAKWVTAPSVDPNGVWQLHSVGGFDNDSGPLEVDVNCAWWKCLIPCTGVWTMWNDAACGDLGGDPTAFTITGYEIQAVIKNAGANKTYVDVLSRYTTAAGALNAFVWDGDAAATYFAADGVCSDDFLAKANQQAAENPGWVAHGGTMDLVTSADAV